MQDIAIPVSDNVKKALVRVPAVTLYFWIIKMMATTVGETGADFLAFNLKWGLLATSLVMSVFLIAALANQFRLKRYVPISYWVVVVLLSIVGTLVTDLMVDDLGVSLLLQLLVSAFYWLSYLPSGTPANIPWQCTLCRRQSARAFTGRLSLPPLHWVRQQATF